MVDSLNWGIIGAGGIARIFARGLAQSQTGTLLAIGSRAQETADLFGEEQHVPRRYGSYQALLDDQDVQAVYIATPHPMHAEWAIRAAEAGKHILCEKPLALNYREALSIVEAARRHDVFLMEAFMYRCIPQTAKLVELVQAGAIGEVQVIQASFSFHAPFQPEGRLWSNALGGGAILDVGCYCTSMARLIAGVATGIDFAEPTSVTGAAHVGVMTRVDEYAVASLTFPGDIIAQLFTGVQAMGNNTVHIFGSEGSIQVPVPWAPRSQDGACVILLQRHDEEKAQEIVVMGNEDLYAIEADTVACYLEARQAPMMSWDDSLGNMKTLDQWRAAVGMVYDAELEKK
ncbi:MAG TPA: Gfo/Idh/MocA family oxidoreductase [Ktedonosporobacter sp.]|jgi:predicted dehydrogenase|nr:Gfo/Idh/MocA family oxidoreductase [Ktedonosporobacter sp.]